MLGGFTRSLSALVHFTLHKGAAVDSVVYMTHNQGFKTNSHHILVYDITHSPSIIEKTIVFVPPLHPKSLFE